MANQPLMTLDRIGELVRLTLEELVARDGSAPASEVLAAVDKRARKTGARKTGHH